jgi:hypothetical protein
MNEDDFESEKTNSLFPFAENLAIIAKNSHINAKLFILFLGEIPITSIFFLFSFNEVSECCVILKSHNLKSYFFGVLTQQKRANQKALKSA